MSKRHSTRCRGWRGPDPAVDPVTDDTAVRELLDDVRARFYAARTRREFYRDRRMLVYALTWPGTWLDRRGLTCPAARYQAIIRHRLADIAVHGDPERYGAYFPTYLLKCLQDWFEHHGDQLYAQLKHIRNALERVLADAALTNQIRRDSRHVELLAATHRLLHASRERRTGPKDSRQLTLF